MSKTFALQHPTEPLHNPHTLGTVALSLATCTHPDSSQLRPAPESEGADPIWCAACGALRFGEGPASRWQPAALPSLLTKKHFEDLVVLLHGVRQLTLLARSQPCTPVAGSRESAIFRSVRASLHELARLPVVQGLDRLEAALADSPATFGRTGEASR
ncbi:MAG: hypothetical protein ACRENE_15365 [Polyangiaceae bacterium]